MSLFTSTSALVLVDVQNDFADPGGALAVAGGEQVVHACNGLLERASQVFCTQDWHPPATPHFQSWDGPEGGGEWPVHCVRDTWGAALHPDLRARGPVVRKGVDGQDGYSGFTVRDPATGRQTPTELDTLLRAAEVDALVVAGLATDYCVLATVLDARALDLPVTVVTRAVAAVDREPGDGDRALAQMRAAGAVLL